MKFLLAIVLLGGLVPAAVAAPAEPRYVEGEVIVAFKSSVDLPKARQSLGRHALQLDKHFATISKMRGRNFGVVRGPGRTTAQLIADLKQDPAVETVEPNYLRQICASVPPNDPNFSLLWGLQNTGQSVNGFSGTSGADIKFNTAWTLARPSTSEVVVAVIDTGADYNNPDLAANVWTNPGENATNNLDDDSNGLVNDVHGWNFADTNSVVLDAAYHGTHVAGTIAGVGNNQFGVIGVDFQAKVMVLRASSDGLNLPDSAIIGAINYAIMQKTQGVNVVAINASFAGPGFDSVMRDAIIAAGNAGIIFCAAAGNSTANNDSTFVYPASYRLTNMIVVAATDQNDGLASFSNYGASTVDLAAPGANIYSTAPVPTSSSVKRFAATYSAIGLTFAGTTNGFNGTIHNCGIGNPGDFPPTVNGNIALIQRGTLNFHVKVANAMAAGARAAIIYNNVAGNFSGTLVGPSNWIPAVSVSQADGATLQTPMGAPGMVINSNILSQAFQYLDGTSMATPHVVGAVAFAAMNFPTESVTQRIQRILTNADPRPGLSGKVITGARLNLRRIVDADTNSLPDWWEQIYFGQLTGTDPSADPDDDGATTLSEWLASTDPTNTLSAFQLTSVVADPSGLAVTWNSVNTRSYYLQRAVDLSLANPFQTIATNLPGQATNTTYTDSTISTNLELFYRVGIQP